MISLEWKFLNENHFYISIAHSIARNKANEFAQRFFISGPRFVMFTQH